MGHFMDKIGKFTLLEIQDSFKQTYTARAFLKPYSAVLKLIKNNFWVIAAFKVSKFSKK